VRIDRNSSIPSYVQVAESLKARIATGEIRPGARIPAERELIAQSGLSRITVRSGLAILEREGWVVRKQGLGTFARNPVNQEISSFRTITEVLLSRGFTPSIRVLHFGAAVPPTRVRRELRLRKGQPLLLIKRLYSVGKVPIALLHIYLPMPMRKHAEVLRDGTAPTETTCTIWENKLGVRLGNARHVIRARTASREDARALGIRRDSPVLVMERVTYAEDGKPLEYVIYHCHPSRYEFSSTVPREETLAGRFRVEPFTLNGEAAAEST